ncbi:MAG: hypothetical protein GXZ04_08380 [Clostridiales bacterium]|nr:hypothetical protein [Clostridiales bacterium]
MPLFILADEFVFEEPVVSPLVFDGFQAPNVPEGEMVDDSYFENAIFIGDSLAEGLALNRLLPTMEFVTKIGQSANGVVRHRVYKYQGKSVRMVELLKAKQPEKLYIWIGSNGVDKYTPEHVIPQYETMLDLFISELPDTLIYCVSLAPVVERRVQREYPRMTNKRIHQFNALIEEAAKTRNCYYLPLAFTLMNEDGGLTKEYSAGDGIHLSKTGYAVVNEFLRTHTIPYNKE